MSNWCYNRLIVTAADISDELFSVEDILKRLDPSSVDERASDAVRVLDALKRDEDPTVLSFETVLPTPVELFDGDGEWWDWRIVHWGTSSDAHEPEVFRGEEAQLEMGGVQLSADCLVYLFDTEGHPPVEWVRVLAAQYPNAVFHLVYRHETGLNYGVYVFHGDLVNRLTMDDDYVEVFADYGVDIE